jgi:cell division protein FtsN
MMFGLSIGLVVAAGVYIADRWELPVNDAAQSTAEAEPQVIILEPDAEPVAEAEPQSGVHFDFYDVLPEFEVVLPSVESEAKPDREAVSVGEPGSYVLQAGSFREVADAERMRASLALLGMESRLQRVSIDDDVYHRVRIGPTSDLNELNRYRRQLWDAEIEVMLIKVPN